MSRFMGADPYACSSSSWSPQARTPCIPYGSLSRRGPAPLLVGSSGTTFVASVQPLGRAVLVEQADSNARRRDAPVAGQVIGGIHQQVAMPRCRHRSPTAIWRISGKPRRSLARAVEFVRCQSGCRHKCAHGSAESRPNISGRPASPPFS